VPTQFHFAPSPPSDFEQPPSDFEQPPSDFEQELLALSSNNEDPAKRNDDYPSLVSYICDDPGCRQQVLLVEMNEHEEMHEAEKLTLDLEDEPSSQLNKMNISTSHSHHSSSPYSIFSASSSQQNFSTSIPSALRHEEHKQSRPKKLQRDPNHPGQHMGRRFLSIIGFERARAQKTATASARLGVSSRVPRPLLSLVALLVLSCGNMS
jgi:hypothetical protein